MPQLRSWFVAAVVVVQGIWLSVLVGRGWFTGPDLANISFAHGRDLDADYLSASLGGHFGAPTRLLYWLLERTDPLAWGLTVGVRVALQALATVLLWKLLTELVGPRRWLPVVLVMYAASAVLVPGISVLSSGIGLEISQAAYLGMLLLHVRYTRSGRRGQALGVAVLALVALVYADQSAPGMLLLPLLSLGVLRTGSVWEQVRRRWLGWALLAAAAVVFAGLYLSGDYTGTSSTFRPSLAWNLVKSEWIDVMGPALLGGPWDWYDVAGSWSPNAGPPLAAKALGQVALLGLIVASLRVTGRRALYGWAVPVVIAIGGVVLVGAGRSELGTFIGAILRYSHFTPLALAIGVTLAFAAAPEEQVVPRPIVLPEGARAVGAVAVTGALVMSVVSAAGFAERFWKNPAPDYVANLTATARSSTGQFFDTSAPASVIPGVEPNHFVSDVLVLTGQRLRFDGLQPDPRMIDPSGRAVAAGFLPAADLTETKTPGCGLLVTGTTTVHLDPLVENTWQLQLQLVQNRSNAFRIEVRDASGRLLPFRHDTASVQSVGKLVAVNRALAFGSPSTVTLVTEDSATSFCLVHAYVGAPFPEVSSLELLKDRAGRLRERLDHPQLRDARRLLRSTADVVMLGESVLVWVGPRDRDRRPLPVMVRDGLRPDATLVSVSGGGYHAGLLAAYLDLLAAVPRRPRAVVLPLWVRGGLLPWIEHPRFGHHDALVRLRELDASRPSWRIRGSLRRGGDWQGYRSLPYETVLGPGTVGDYVVPLKGGALSGDERLRLLYAYHHGGVVETAGFTALGEAARALDVPVVAYQAPVSVATGERVLPGLTERVARNFALADAAFTSALDVPVLQTGTAFAEDEFIDPSDGSEHLNERGRRRLADLLVTEVRARL